MQKSTSDALILVSAAIAVASMCVSGYALALADDRGGDGGSDGGSLDAGEYYRRVTGYAEQIRAQTDIVPEIAVVLGSGLGSFIEGIDVHTTIPYSSLEGFPVSTVSGHSGNFVLGMMAGKPVIAMQGRVHYYEGYSPADVVLPLRVMHELGARTVFITNAVGSLNYDYEPGTLMVVRDHISLVPSPLIGPNIPELGERFPPMEGIYDSYIMEKVKEIADSHGITVHRGTFIQVTGPQFETPAEIQAYRQWGADTVGMSSAIESIAAAHCSMRICNINCITNLGSGMGGGVPTHEETEKMGKKMAKDLVTILDDLIPMIDPPDGPSEVPPS